MDFSMHVYAFGVYLSPWKKLVGHYGTWSYVVLDISPNRGYDDHVSVCFDMNGVNWQSQLNGFHI